MTPLATVTAPVTAAVSQLATAAAATTTVAVVPAVQQSASGTISAAGGFVGDATSVVSNPGTPLDTVAAPVTDAVSQVASAATTTTGNVIPAVQQVAATTITTSNEAPGNTGSAISTDPATLLGGTTTPVTGAVSQVVSDVTASSGGSATGVAVTTLSRSITTPATGGPTPTRDSQGSAGPEPADAVAATTPEPGAPGTDALGSSDGVRPDAIGPAALDALTNHRLTRYADASVDTVGVMYSGQAWTSPPGHMRPAARATTLRLPAPRPTSSNASPWLLSLPRMPEGQSGSAGGGTSHAGQVLAWFATETMLLVAARRRRLQRELASELFLIAPLSPPG